MLETIIVVLVLLWLVGMVSWYTLGGLIHVLLVIAVIVLLLRNHSRPAGRCEEVGSWWLAVGSWWSVRALPTISSDTATTNY